MTVSTPVEIIPVPDVAKKAHPWAQTVDVGPPPGVGDEECGTANSLVEPGRLGDYVTNEWRTFFKLSEEQLATLAAGGSICFVMTSGQMVPHRSEVWPGELTTEPAVPIRVELRYGVGTRAASHDICDDWFGKEEGKPPTIDNLKNVPTRAIQLAEIITVVMSDGSTHNIKERNPINNG